MTVPQVEPIFKDGGWKCSVADPACTRAKPCVTDRNRRNQRSGKRFQREVRKAVERVTDTIAAKFRGQLGNEEAWHGLPWRVEAKYGKQSEPAVTQYEKARAQSDQSHAFGDTRPFVNVVGIARGRMVVQVDLEDLPDLLESLPQ